MSTTYAIRKWAFRNARIAQGLIVVATLLLFFLGHLIGVLAESLGADMYAMFLIGTGIAILAWVLAPRKGEDFPIRYSYARQKVAVVIMLKSMTVGIGGWAVCLERMDVQPIASVESHQSEAAVGPTFSKKASANRVDHALADWFHGGILKRLLKRTRDLTKGKFRMLSSKKDTVVAAIVVYFLALLFAFLVALLSCSLSCNGHTLLAVLVACGGLLLVLAFIDGHLKNFKNRSPKKVRRKEKEPLPDS